MSSHSKPLLVVTRPTPLAALPPEVAERGDRSAAQGALRHLRRLSLAETGWSWC